MAETLDLETSLQLQNQLKQLQEENDRLKKELNQHQVIVNNTLDAIFICNKEMKIVQANEAAARMLQVKPEELKARSVLDFLFAIPEEELVIAIKKFLIKDFYGKRSRSGWTAERQSISNFLRKRKVEKIPFL